MVGAAVALAPLFDAARACSDSAPDQLTFLAPIQQAGNATTIEVQNVEAGAATTSWTGQGLMVLLALAMLAWMTSLYPRILAATSGSVWTAIRRMFGL